jgi:hypothetical protein
MSLLGTPPGGNQFGHKATTGVSWTAASFVAAPSWRSSRLEHFGILGVLVGPEDGGCMFLRNVRLSPNYPEDCTLHSLRSENLKLTIHANNICKASVSPGFVKQITPHLSLCCNGG